MKRQMAAMMTGAILAMSAMALPAFASGARTNTQPSVGAQQQKHVLSTKGCGVQQQKWSIINEKGAIGRLTRSERAKLNQFKAGIERGLSPQVAAKKVGSTQVTLLNSLINRSEKCTNRRLYEIRLSLSQQASATFWVNGQTNVVSIRRAGK